MVDDEYLRCRSDEVQPGDFVTMFGSEIGPIVSVTMTSHTIVSYHLGVGHPRPALRRTSEIAIRRPRSAPTVTAMLTEFETKTLADYLESLLKPNERTTISTAD